MNDHETEGVDSQIAKVNRGATSLLVALAVLLLAVGMVVTHESVYGLSIVGAACMVAVFARMHQDRTYHEALMKHLEQRADKTNQPSNAD